MKKLRTVLLMLIMIMCLSACSSVEDAFHYDLIKKYSTDDKYYTHTYKGIEIENFGAKYGVSIYDIERADGELRYYYAYDGNEKNVKGETDLKNYLEYLNSNFERDDKRGGNAFCVVDDQYLIVMKYDLADNAGKMVVVVVPSDVKAESGDTLEFNLDVESASAIAED